ncbi:hypothetical protein, partial [Virgibacillus halodenitrificans]|uniref:hypothetical protein n=1 Tax=Virgibacillus halodenitrificans TaxID=1482 RepID=UPI002DBCD729
VVTLILAEGFPIFLSKLSKERIRRRFTQDPFFFSLLGFCPSLFFMILIDMLRLSNNLQEGQTTK